jgi:hypothetical protein
MRNEVKQQAGYAVAGACGFYHLYRAQTQASLLHFMPLGQDKSKKLCTKQTSVRKKYFTKN